MHRLDLCIDWICHRLDLYIAWILDLYIGWSLDLYHRLDLYHPPYQAPLPLPPPTGSPVPVVGPWLCWTKPLASPSYPLPPTPYPPPSSCGEGRLGGSEVTTDQVTR